MFSRVASEKRFLQERENHKLQRTASVLKLFLVLRRQIDQFQTNQQT